jgi:hypothetical protein
MHAGMSKKNLVWPDGHEEGIGVAAGRQPPPMLSAATTWLMKTLPPGPRRGRGRRVRRDELKHRMLGEKVRTWSKDLRRHLSSAPTSTGRALPLRRGPPHLASSDPDHAPSREHPPYLQCAHPLAWYAHKAFDRIPSRRHRLVQHARVWVTHDLLLDVVWKY